MNDLGPVAEPLREPLKQFALRLRELAGENALAWVLYGPVVAGTFDRKRHAVRSVLVLKSVDLELLRRLAEEGAQHRDARPAVPLVVTPALLSDSRDTFPLELIEIQQQYFTVFGDDFFGALKFQDQHIRLQCERELKVQLISFRQGLLASAGSERHLGALKDDWADGIFRILRGMLWLKGQKSGLPAERVLAKVEHLLVRPLPGIHQALTNHHTMTWESFCKLYADVEALSSAVDVW